MSVYLVKGKGWRYDFTLRGKRFTSNWFRTKAEARAAEVHKREELRQAAADPQPQQLEPQPAANLPPPPDLTPATTPTGMVFLDLVNKRLDHVQAYNSKSYYQTCVSAARGWVKRWGQLRCSQISREMVEQFALERKMVSAYTANKEMTYLKATFNFGLKKGLVTHNPVSGITKFPEEKRLKYVPPAEDIDRVIALADRDTQDYLWTIRDTLARVSEVNRLRWDDVNLEQRYVVLYTRKKRGGHLTPRKVPLTDRLLGILSRRFRDREPTKPWVFWHWYRHPDSGARTAGPYQDRREVLKNLCNRAGVRHFRFHALRHAGASLMDSANVPLGVIQRILGHENRTTTEIYLHSLGDLERAAMAIYEQACGSAGRVSHDSHIKSHINSHINRPGAQTDRPEPQLST
jgi:integrase